MTAHDLTIYRLELPGDLAEPVAQAAAQGERTVPGQIRHILRSWVQQQQQQQEVQ